MSGYVRDAGVLVGQNVDSREEMLRLIARCACELGVASDEQAVYEAFLAREELGETGMTDGFAVPHAKTDAATQPAVLVVKNDHPLAWPSFDDKPVDIAIALLVPGADASDTHIRLLSRIAVLLMKDDFKKLVRESDDAPTIAKVVNEAIESDGEGEL